MGARGPCAHGAGARGGSSQRSGCPSGLTLLDTEGLTSHGLPPRTQLLIQPPHRLQPRHLPTYAAAAPYAADNAALHAALNATSANTGPAKGTLPRKQKRISSTFPRQRLLLDAEITAVLSDPGRAGYILFGL